MIDLNADLGEGMGDDAAMLGIVTSASIACGGHAGTPETMRRAVLGALANGVRIGAHPGFADPENFGRERLDLPAAVIVHQVLDQIETLRTIAARQGVGIAYLKLHGALANMAAEDEHLSRALFAAAIEQNPGLAILALAASAQERAAIALGLPVIPEAYADRAYTPAGLLVGRDHPDAVIHDTAAVVERCLRIAASGEILSIDGTIVPTTARSICLHGDTPGALQLARAVRIALEEAGRLPQRPAKTS